MTILGRTVYSPPPLHAHTDNSIFVGMMYSHHHHTHTLMTVSWKVTVPIAPHTHTL